jgi:hypothetical protein
MLRMAHVGRFPNRSFGKDLQLIVVYGAVILAFLESRKPTIASIARYLQLPHETTRRYLKTVVDLGLLTKNGRSYKPTERSRKGVAGANKIERLLRRTARDCICNDFSPKWGILFPACLNTASKLRTSTPCLRTVGGGPFSRPKPKMTATEIVLGFALLYAIGALIWRREQREIKPPED